MAHDVFLSYSNKDKPIADAVVAGLEHKGIRCWMAPRDVTPGTSWGEAIIEAIESSKAMVVILSGNSDRSRQVIREVERAVAHEEIIIPFRIENIDPTGAMAYFLSSEHWLDALTPPMEKHIDKLGDTIQLFLTGSDREKIEGEEIVATPRSPTFGQQLQSLPLWAKILSFVVIALAVGFVVQILFNNTPLVSPTSVSQITTSTIPVSSPTPMPPPAFSTVGEYRTSRSANALYVTNNMLHLANGGDGLVRLNVSDPTNLKLVDTYQVGDAQNVVVADGVAYIVSGEDSRRLVIMPLGGEEGSYTFPPEGQMLGGARSLYNVAVVGGLAHLTGHNYWGILDVKDPTQPKELWSWEPTTNSGNPCTAAIQGNIAYIGGGWTGLHIFGISDPQNQVLLGRYDTPHWIVGIIVVDEILYLTMGEGGILSLDVTDPSRPLLMTNLELPGFASDLSAVENTLFVIYNVTENYVTTESGVVAIDVTDPEAMAIITTYDKFNSASDIQVVDDNIYVSDSTRGVFVMSFGQLP